MFFIRTFACALAALLLLGRVSTAYASNIQDIEMLSKVVRDFVHQQTNELPGRVQPVIGAIDPRLRLAACNKPEPFVPAGNRLWGNTTVGVRCASATPWTIYIPVTVKVIGQTVVAARPVAVGKVIEQADLLIQEADLTQLPSGVLTEPGQALGKTASAGMAAGQPMRADMLRAPTVIRPGQTVKLVAEGQGFHVTSEGRALSNAAVGQSVSVRTSSGQVVSGTVRADGAVEVSY